MGDAIGAGIVYHLSKAELEELDRREAEKQAANLHHLKDDSAMAPDVQIAETTEK